MANVGTHELVPRRENNYMQPIDDRAIGKLYIYGKL